MVASNRSTPASKRRVEANRRNALKSTGPKTPEGKAKCARNALKHGLTAELGLLPGEDPAEFERFKSEMLGELKPVGSLQRAFAEQIVWSAWRLRRVPAAESAVMWRQHRERVAAWEKRQARREKYGAVLDCGPAEPRPNRRSAHQVLADRFTDAKHDPLGRVEMHAVRLQRSFLWSLRALQQLQKRGSEAVDDPPAVDSAAPAGGPVTVFVDDRRRSADPSGATALDGDAGAGGGSAEAVGADAGTEPSAEGIGEVDAGQSTEGPCARPSPRPSPGVPGEGEQGTRAAVQNEANAGAAEAAHPTAGGGLGVGEAIAEPAPADDLPAGRPFGDDATDQDGAGERQGRPS